MFSSFPLAGSRGSWSDRHDIIERDPSLHFRDGVSIREIERRTGLSRNTVGKYLRSGSVEPRFELPDRPSKLDPYADRLSAWLRIETGRSRKQRRTARHMYADLVTLGYDGSYNRVTVFVRD